MPNKTISVPERDLALWERGERAAGRRRMSMSGLVLTAVAQYLGEDMDTITVQMFGQQADVQFSGRWLVTPPPDAPSLGDPEPDPTEEDPAFGHTGKRDEWRAGIAETARGRIVVHLRHWDAMEACELHDFDTLDDAESALGADARIPRCTWKRARDLLQSGNVVWRDL